MKFPTQFDPYISKSTDPGKAEYITYSADDKGNPISSGISNIQKEIDSHRESVELATLLQRYAAGDETALHNVDGAYVDVSGVSGQSFQDIYDSVKQAEDDFNGLPSDFKKLFNNSTVEFWSQFGSDDFNKKIAQYRDSKHSNKKSFGKSDHNNTHVVEGGNDLNE